MLKPVNVDSMKNENIVLTVSDRISRWNYTLSVVIDDGGGRSVPIVDFITPILGDNKRRKRMTRINLFEELNYTRVTSLYVN